MTGKDHDDEETAARLSRASVQGRLELVVEMLEQALAELRAEIDAKGGGSP